MKPSRATKLKLVSALWEDGQCKLLALTPLTKASTTFSSTLLALIARWLTVGRLDYQIPASDTLTQSDLPISSQLARASPAPLSCALL